MIFHTDKQVTHNIYIYPSIDFSNDNSGVKYCGDGSIIISMIKMLTR